jgi:hypothetical protein
VRCPKRWWMFSQGRYGRKYCRKCLARSCWSTVSGWWCDLLIDSKIALANMNMTSPTGNVTMLATTITNFCSHTDKSRIYSLVDPSPYDHQVIWGWFRRSFTGVIPSGCVNPEGTNEMVNKGNRGQCNSRRSDVSPSLPRGNTNALSTSTDNMGNRDEPNRTLFVHVWRKGEKRGLSKTNKILIRNKNSYPHKRKKINDFPHSKDPYFL